MIRISLDGAQFSRQTTYLLLSFAFIKGNEAIKSAGVQTPYMPATYESFF